MLRFVFYYPLVMSIVWTIGALVFFWRRERGALDSPPILQRTPFVSVLIPCFNEGNVLADTLDKLQHLTYPHYEIIVLNDGSDDQTIDVLREIVSRYPNLRVVNIPVRRGKAHALNVGLFVARGEILVTLDADAVLHPNAIEYLVAHFVNPGGERVGAVTGNPRIRNRASLLGKIQIVEYGSIIGLIKRSQRVLGKVMTVSGVVAAFRKKALLDSGLWDEDMITDDIAVSWKLQRRFWDIRYEPRAICWMWVPETVRGLWRQRMRWVQGGIEVLIRHCGVLFSWKQRRIIPVYLEECLSVIWAYSWVLSLCWMAWRASVSGVPLELVREGGTMLAMMSLVQAAAALAMDGRYEEGSLLRYYFWAIWYPALYWILGALAVVYATPKAILRMARSSNRTYAVWTSPDRGIRA
jgi:biofilm PGA synthesis N-glycosyltransferase PgaC